MIEVGNELLGSYLWGAYRAFFVLVEEKLQEYPIGAETLHIMLTLYNQGSLQQKELVRYFNKDKATLGRRLAKLEKEGLVKRIEDPADKRTKLVKLTEKGREKETEFRDIMRSIEDRIKSELSRTELKQFTRTIAKIHQILNRE
ncbi:MAG: MarR family winged helix-turn-helix transcriptional regulator [Candidatus Bipolaricaulota bacterium]